MELSGYIMMKLGLLLGYTQVRDVGFMHLKKKAGLQRLDLKYTEVTIQSTVRRCGRNRIHLGNVGLKKDRFAAQVGPKQGDSI